MKIRHIIRMQGTKWTNYKRSNRLRIIAIGKSKSSNYVSYTIDERNHVVRHWLGHSEALMLERSNWVDTHKIYDSDVLYDRKTLCDLKKELLSRLQA